MTVSVFNLNIMHGRNRRSALWPLRVSKREAQANLEKVVECVRRHSPDIVALQEVDEYSLLSGGFNQYKFLHEKLGYPYSFFASSCYVQNTFQSGQALFSKYPLHNCETYPFPLTFPTDRMGFVVADTKLPAGPTITVASLHLVGLDWLRRDPRAQELELIEKVIRARKNPAILAGDFNCDTADFAGRMALMAPTGLPTYPSWNPSARIDWILAPANASFVSYQTIPDKLSDHLAVTATLNFSQN